MGILLSLNDPAIIFLHPHDTGLATPNVVKVIVKSNGYVCVQFRVDNLAYFQNRSQHRRCRDNSGILSRTARYRGMFTSLMSIIAQLSN